MPSPAREVLADRNFRNFWLAQTCLAGINGTVRFTFVWLVVTLTDWSAAEGIVAGLLGLPAMLLSLPAGALADRVDRRRLYFTWAWLTLALVAIFTAMIVVDAVNPFIAGVVAVLIGTAISINPPALNAMVPQLVPEERLMNAIALQNGAFQAASFTTVVLAGVGIEVLGDAGGFALLTAMAVAAIWFMRPVRFPDRPAASAVTESFGRSVAAGLRYGASVEPIRSLLLLAMLLGSSFAVMQINMPRVVESDFERDAASAALVMGAFGVGMMLSSVAMAGRQGARHGRNIAICIGFGLGGGQLALSLAPGFWIAIVIMLVWGLNAGVAMTSHRTLLQRATDPAMMGRVMGLMMTGFLGGLPIGAAASSLLSLSFSPADTMTVVGIATIVLAGAVSWRPSIVRLT